jgi:hypothetical protein
MDALEQRSILYRASLASVEAEIYCRIKDELYGLRSSGARHQNGRGRISTAQTKFSRCESYIIA